MAGKIILKSLEEQDTSMEVSSIDDSFQDNTGMDFDDSSEVC